MSPRLVESDVEDVAIEYFQELGYQYVYGRVILPLICLTLNVLLIKNAISPKGFYQLFQFSIPLSHRMPLRMQPRNSLAQSPPPSLDRTMLSIKCFLRE